MVLILAAPALSGCVSESEQGRGDGPTPSPDIVAEQPADEPAEFPEGSSGNPDLGDFRVNWTPPTGPYHQQYYEAFRRAQTFENTTQLLNRLLILPHDLPIVHHECQVANAFYEPAERRITLCYELLELIAQMFDDPAYSPEEYGAAVTSAWLFIFFHEMGHGLIDLYDLPVTGREEDAVDDLATLILIDMGVGEAALMAAFFWYGLDDQEYTTDEFADEHSLDPQRFFAIMCTVYGSAPGNFTWLVSEGHLPADRAERCSYDYEQKDASWTKLLEPWFKTEPIPDDYSATIDPPSPFPRPRGAPPPPPPPQTQYLASSKAIAVPADSVYHHTIVLDKYAVISFAFEVVDTSSLDVGILRNADLMRYEDGEAVDSWVYYSEVQAAQDEVELPPDVYDLVFFCLNSYFDCDLEYTLAVTS